MIYQLLERITTIGLSLIEQAGYLGVFSVSFLENVFTPIPSEAVIPFAGILVSQNKFSLLTVVLSATLGSLAGAYVFYGLGYVLGSEKIRLWIIKWGKYFFIQEQDLDRAEVWFEKYGSWAVLICRVIPLVRSFISIPAGYVRMPVLKFSILTAAGTAVWSTLLVTLGIILGNNYTQVIPIFRKLDIVFVLLIIGLIGYYVVKKLSNRKNSNSTPEIETDS